MAVEGCFAILAASDENRKSPFELSNMNYIKHTRLFDYRTIYKDIDNWAMEFTLELFFPIK